MEFFFKTNHTKFIIEVSNGLICNMSILDQWKVLNLALARWGSCLQAPLILGMRLFWGYWYARSGMIKLAHLPEVAAYFESLSIPFPMAAALVTGILHLLGSISLVLGWAARLMSIPLIISMIIAYLTAHLDATKALLSDPVQFILAPPFLFLLTNLLVLAYGPGKYSIDALNFETT